MMLTIQVIILHYILIHPVNYTAMLDESQQVEIYLQRYSLQYTQLSCQYLKEYKP